MPSLTPGSGEGQWGLHTLHPEVPQILSFRLQLQAPRQLPALPVREGRAGAGAEASGWGLGGGPDGGVCPELPGRRRAARVRPQRSPVPSPKLPAARLGTPGFPPPGDAQEQALGICRGDTWQGRVLFSLAVRGKPSHPFTSLVPRAVQALPSRAGADCEE